MGRAELLDLAVDAHGGLRRWEEITRFRVAASITGTIWAMKGKPGLLDNVVLEGETKDQRLKITPFPKADRFATWEPGRVTIQSGDGAVVDERRDPASSFAGHTRQTPWDLFQVVGFASEANW